MEAAHSCAAVLLLLTLLAMMEGQAAQRTLPLSGARHCTQPGREWWMQQPEEARREEGRGRCAQRAQSCP